MYAGHSSPVVSLAPSPDGRWLASGSMDQTVMFYPLDGCDAQAPLGFTYAPRRDGVLGILSVEPRSFAAAMGLFPGDVLVQVGIGWGEDNKRFYNTPQEIEGFFGQLPRLDPYLYKIGIKVRRTLMIPTIGLITYETELPTTRRNNPALVLFLGTDREWLVWTPRGYYDTSIEGDARFLGWHINPPFRTTRPTDFVPIGTFAATMNRRDILDRVWRTGVLDQAAAVPAPAPAAAPARAPVAAPPTVVAVKNQPPRIVFDAVPGGIQLPAPGVLWVVDRPNPRIALRISASGESATRQRRVILDEGQLLPDRNVGPDREHNEVVPLNGLPPNRRLRLAVEATNEGGWQRTETIDLIYRPPAQPGQPVAAEPPPRPAPHLHTLAIGCDRFAGGLPAVEFAARDASTLAEWLAGHLTSAEGTKTTVQRPEVLAGAKASVASIRGACDHLQKLVRNKQVHEHDIMVVVIASHLLSSKDGVVIAAADTVAGNALRPAFAAADLCELMGQLTDYGCRVVVFLDGVHQLDQPVQSEIKPFVRDLQQKRRVITFIASKEGPSGADRIKQNGFFTLGVTQVFAGADLAGARKDRSGAYTLDQFRTAVQNEVLNLSGSAQHARFATSRPRCPRVSSSSSRSRAWVPPERRISPGVPRHFHLAARAGVLSSGINGKDDSPAWRRGGGSGDVAGFGDWAAWAGAAPKLPRRTPVMGNTRESRGSTCFA